jgi:acyl dehydratase/CBS domain-containing protein
MLVPLSVRDVVSTDVETVGPAATVRAVAERLHRDGIGSLVVCDEEACPVGIVTESDVVSLLARGSDPDDTLVADVMTEDVVTVPPDVTLEQAAETLATHDIRQLPVVDGDVVPGGDESEAGEAEAEADAPIDPEVGRLVGIVTAADLSQYLPQVAGRDADTSDRTESPSPEMLYDDRNWEFEHAGPDETSVDVGDVVRFRKVLDDADVRAFAEASGDTNRLHLDEEFARETRFGGRIAHGTLVAGTVSAALARLPGLTIYLAQDLRYLGPVEIGERVTAVCEVVENLGGRKYRLRTAVYDGDGERVVDGESTVLVDDLPAGADRPASDAGEA